MEYGNFKQGLGYLNTIDGICSNFYRHCMHYFHGYPKMYYYLIRISKQRNAYFWMLLGVNIYEYERILLDVLCKNIYQRRISCGQFHVSDIMNSPES